MTISSLIKSLDYFFVLRPILFIPGWSTLLAGYLISSNKKFFLYPDNILHLNYVELGILLIVFSAAMGASFMLNQLMDIESDLKNKKLFILSENHISKKAAITEVIFLIIISILLALKFNNGVLISVIMFIVVTGFLYNFKPFILKDRPYGSIIANASMGWLAFALGWYTAQNPGWQIIYDSLPYLFFNTALYFFTTLPDISGDRKSEKHTLAVLYGINVIIIIALVLYGISLLSAFFLNDYVALVFIFCTFPFFVFVYIKKDITATIQTTKYAIFFFAMVICLKIPFYFLVLLVTFIFTRWYFKRRFHYNYPNFKGE